MLRSKNKKLLKKGSYSLAFTVVVIAIAVFLNLLISELPPLPQKSMSVKINFTVSVTRQRPLLLL